MSCHSEPPQAERNLLFASSAHAVEENKFLDGESRLRITGWASFQKQAGFPEG